MKFHHKLPHQNIIFQKITGSRILEPSHLLWEYKIVKWKHHKEIFLMRAFASLWAFPLVKREAWDPLSISSHRRRTLWRPQLEVYSLRFVGIGEWGLTNVWESQSCLWTRAWLLPGKSRDQGKSWWTILGADLRNTIATK